MPLYGRKVPLLIQHVSHAIFYVKIFVSEVSVEKCHLERARMSINDNLLNLRNLPVINQLGVCLEVDADFEQLAWVGGKRQGIAFIFYLLQGCSGRLVHL